MLVSAKLVASISLLLVINLFTSIIYIPLVSGGFLAIALLFQVRLSQLQVLVYPCYDEKAHNMNQIWKIRAARLLWEPQGGGNPICVDSRIIKEKAPRGAALRVP